MYTVPVDILPHKLPAARMYYHRLPAVRIAAVGDSHCYRHFAVHIAAADNFWAAADSDRAVADNLAVDSRHHTAADNLAVDSRHHTAADNPAVDSRHHRTAADNPAAGSRHPHTVAHSPAAGSRHHTAAHSPAAGSRHHTAADSLAVGHSRPDKAEHNYSAEGSVDLVDRIPLQRPVR